MGDQIRILVADDHPIFREGLVGTIERNKRFVVAAQAGDGNEALRQIRELHPDLAILDISMPGMDGLEVARHVHNEGLPTELVIMTMYKDPTYFNAALDLGVRGYILKDSVSTELISCLDAITASHYYVSPPVSHLLTQRSSKAKPSTESLSVRDRLTPAELVVLRFVAENLTSKDIAERLSVSIRTVENHRSHICQKLGVKGPHALLEFAIANKAAL